MTAIPNQETLLACAVEMAEAARIETLRFFRVPDLGTENKLSSGFDPVTEADRAAETAMRAVLKRLRPDDGIIGEEHGVEKGTTGLTWVLDPIDGTRGFISGTPTWGVLIGLQDENGMLLGVIDQPYVSERFIGGFGSAYLEHAGQRRVLQTSHVTELSNATLLTTFPEVGTAQERAAFEAVSQQTQLTRFGMDCYAYALLALGTVDLVIEAGLNAYDIAAPVGLIEAAGGIVTNWEGGPAHEGGRALAAANSVLHEQALEILQKAQKV